MSRYLYLDPELCTGCRCCESACSVTNEKVINRAKSRIHVYRSDVLSLVQLYCDQCTEHPCLSACPEKAIIVDNGQVRVDDALCTGCGKCTLVCSKLFLSPDKTKILMCNQCGSCIVQCPENALKMRKR